MKRAMLKNVLLFVMAALVAWTLPVNQLEAQLGGIDDGVSPEGYSDNIQGSLLNESKKSIERRKEKAKQEEKAAKRRYKDAMECDQNLPIRSWSVVHQQRSVKPIRGRATTVAYRPVYARLDRIGEETVFLRKKDGELVELEKKRLSPACKEYVGREEKKLLANGGGKKNGDSQDKNGGKRKNDG